MSIPSLLQDCVKAEASTWGIILAKYTSRSMMQNTVKPHA